jgi:hypothetical protein
LLDKADEEIKLYGVGPDGVYEWPRAGAMFCMVMYEDHLTAMRSRAEGVPEELLDAIQEIDYRFMSGNSVKVEKAAIPATEWEPVRKWLKRAAPTPGEKE